MKIEVFPDSPGFIDGSKLRQFLQETKSKSLTSFVTGGDDGNPLLRDVKLYCLATQKLFNQLHCLAKRVTELNTMDDVEALKKIANRILKIEDGKEQNDGH